MTGKQILQAMYDAMPDTMTTKRKKYSRKPVFIVSLDIGDKLKQEFGRIPKKFNGLRIYVTGTLPKDNARLG